MREGEIWIKSAAGAEIEMSDDGSMSFRDALEDEIAVDANSKQVTVRASNNLVASLGQTTITAGRRLPNSEGWGADAAANLATMLVPGIGPEEYVEVETGRKIPGIPDPTTGAEIFESQVQIRCGNVNPLGALDPTGQAVPPSVEVQVKSATNPLQSANVKIEAPGATNLQQPTILLNETDIPGDIIQNAKMVARAGDVTRLNAIELGLNPTGLLPAAGPDVLTWMSAVHASINALYSLLNTTAQTVPGLGQAIGAALATAQTTFNTVTGGLPCNEIKTAIYEGSPWVKAGGAPTGKVI